jgi:hypothetical protein
MYGIDPQLSAEQAERFRALTAGRKVGVITHSVCVVDSVGISIEPAPDSPGTFATKRTVTMNITVAVDGALDDCFELHRYDPRHEKWLHSEFIGMTVDDAKDLVSARVKQEFSD